MREQGPRALPLWACKAQVAPPSMLDSCAMISRTCRFFSGASPISTQPERMKTVAVGPWLAVYTTQWTQVLAADADRKGSKKGSKRGSKRGSKIGERRRG